MSIGPINLKFLYLSWYCFNIFVISRLDNHSYGLFYESGAKGLNICLTNNSLFI